MVLLLQLHLFYNLILCVSLQYGCQSYGYDEILLVLGSRGSCV